MRPIRAAGLLAASFAIIGHWGGAPGATSGDSPAVPTGFVDCNDNGIDDSDDVTQGTSSDCNGNGIPDECDVVLQVTPLTITTDPTRGVDIGDIDGDGDLDVLGRALWYENTDGLGSFGPGQPSIPDDSVYGQAAKLVHLGDMDGDSDLDALRAIAVDNGAAIVWSENLDGMGEFRTETLVFLEEGKGKPDHHLEDFYIADANGDDDNDVFVLVHWRDKVGVAEGWWVQQAINSGTGSFNDGTIADQVSGSLCENPFGCPMFARVADLDNDGDPDVLTHWTHFPELRWVENNGLGVFGSPQIIDIGELSALEVADLDGDQDLDIITASSVLDEIAWYENDGFGNFGARQVLVDADGSLLATDLDADGDTDLVSVHDGVLVWYENLDGSGSLAPEQVLLDGLPHDAGLAADLSGDGLADILGKNHVFGPVSWYRNEGATATTTGFPMIVTRTATPTASRTRASRTAI